MHRGDHTHHHGGFGADHHHDHHAGMGHNGPRSSAQWQTPHRPPGEEVREPARLKDLDLVEASFVEGFGQASDMTSFLRLAGIPFVGEDQAGRRFHLLRVEIDDATDFGSVVPLLGGAGVRYDPLPSRFVSRRRTLAFAYHDGETVLRLDFSAARALADVTDASHFDIGHRA